MPDIEIKMTFYQLFLDRLPLLYVFLSGIGFSMQALVIKLLSEQGFHGSLHCVTMRGILQCLMSLGFIYFNEERRNGTAPNLFGNTWNVKMILFLRSLTGFGSIAAGYLAIEYIPVGDSTVLVMLSPMIAAILSYFLLGEPWRIPEFIGTILSLIGAVFVARPPFLFGHQAGDMSSTDSTRFYTGVFLALFASLNASVAFILVRVLGTSAKMPWCYVTLSQSLAQIFLAPPLMLFVGIRFDQIITLHIGLLIVTGAFIGAVSQAAMTIGMQREKSASATAMRMSDVVFGFIWQAAFTYDPLNSLAIIGAVLVTCSILVVVIFKPQTTPAPSNNKIDTTGKEITDTQIEMIDLSDSIHDGSLPITDISKSNIGKNSSLRSSTVKKSLKEIIAASLYKISYLRNNFSPDRNREATRSNYTSRIHEDITKYSKLAQVEPINDDV